MLYGHYIESYTAERKTEPDELSVTMHPLVFTYLVRYEFSHGLKYVALARGALAGMAGAVWLNSGRTAEEAATVLYDCTVEDIVVSGIEIPDEEGMEGGSGFDVDIEDWGEYEDIELPL